MRSSKSSFNPAEVSEAKGFPAVGTFDSTNMDVMRDKLELAKNIDYTIYKYPRGNEGVLGAYMTPDKKVIVTELIRKSVGAGGTKKTPDKAFLYYEGSGLKEAYDIIGDIQSSRLKDEDVKESPFGTYLTSYDSWIRDAANHARDIEDIENSGIAV